MSSMINILFISLTKDKDIINIDIDKNSKFILEEGIHSIQKYQTCILIILLYNSSSVYSKEYLEGSVLLVLRNNM